MMRLHYNYLDSLCMHEFRHSYRQAAPKFLGKPILFACWFQPAQISQPTVFSSHNKPTPASSNQSRNQPANRPIIATTKTLIRSNCGTNIYLESKQRQSSKRCKKEMVPGLSCWLADHAGGEASEEQ